MSITAAKLYVEVDGDSSGAERAMDKADKGISGLMKSATKGSMVLGGALVAALGASTLAGAKFEKSMVASTAIMDVTTKQQEEMGTVARKVARETVFSANETADAYFFLASAGLDAEQSMAALPQVAAFAAAGQFDLARATDLATDAQSALGMASTDAQENLNNLTRVTDVLVKANTLANASVEQFSEALTNKAGAALRAANKPMEEGVAVLAAFADRGVKGSEAGEKLNIMLRDIPRAVAQNSAEFSKLGIELTDAEGNMKHMGEVVKEMDAATAGMSDTQRAALYDQLGLNRGVADAIKILGGAGDEILEYDKALYDAGGTTADVAEKQVQNFLDQMKILGGIIADVGITLYEKFIGPLLSKAMPVLQSAAERLGWLADNFGRIDPAILGAIGGAILMGLVPALVALAGSLWATFAPLVPFLAIGAALGAVVALVVKRFGGWGAVMDRVRDALSPVITFVRELVGGIRDGLRPVDVIGNALEVAFGQGARERFKQIVAAFEPLVETLRTTWQTLKDNLEPALDSLRNAWDGLKPVLGAVAGILGGLVAGVIGVVIGLVNGFARAIGPLVRAIGGVVAVVTNVFNLIKGIFTRDGDLVKQAAQGIIDGIVDVFAGLKGAVEGFMRGFVDGIVGFFTGLYNALVGNSIVPDMINGIVKWFAGLPGKVFAIVAKFVTRVVTFYLNLGKRVLTAVGSLVKGVVDFFRGIWGKVSSHVSGLVSRVVGRATDLRTQFTARVSALVSSVVDFFRGLPGRAAGALGALASNVIGRFNDVRSRVSSWRSSFISSITSWFTGIGRSIVSGIRSGISAGWSGLTSYFRGLIDKLPAVVKKALGISSPSKLFAGLAEAIPEGMAVGIDGASGLVADSLRDMVPVEATKKRLAEVQKAVNGFMPPAGTLTPAMVGSPGSGHRAAPHPPSQTTYDFSGATFVVPVPDGRVGTFQDELGRVVGRAATLRRAAVRR